MQHTRIQTPLLPALALSILGLLFAGLVVLINRIIIIRREYRLKQQVLQAEQEILQLQNQNLETEVAAKNSRLMSIALQMAHKNEILVNIREKLLDIRKETTAKDTRLLRSLIRMVEAELQDEDFWDQFNLYFDQVNQHYISGLLERHPNLTQNDLRICALTRINLSTKEMAAILNVSVRGVEKSRYRLKKRLDLTPEDDLVEYLRQFAGMDGDIQESLN